MSTTINVPAVTPKPAVAPAYLTEQVKKALGVQELKPKNLYLDELMTAFMSRITDRNADLAISMEVSALAKHYAEKLARNEFVVFFDPSIAREYYVKAFGDDLVAVFYTYGPWYNCYSVMAGQSETLENLGMKGPVTRDVRILDGLFGFGEYDLSVVPDVVTGSLPNDNRPRWDWHQKEDPAVKAAAALEAQNQANDLKVRREQAGLTGTEGGNEHHVAVKAPVHVMQPLGEPRSTERRIQAAARGGDNQMSKAFQEAEERGQGNGNRADRRNARQQDQQRHPNHNQNNNRGQQQHQPQSQSRQEPSSAQQQETAHP